MTLRRFAPPYARRGQQSYGVTVTGSAGSRPSGRPGDNTVYRITEAGAPHSDDLNKRINKYLISMAIRTVCVILAVVVHGWVRWIFIAGAIALPYVAVLLANSRNVRRGPRIEAVTADPRVQGLGAADPTRVIFADEPVEEPLARRPKGG